MTPTDRELIRGWQAAKRGLALAPHETAEYAEGYAIWIETARRKRLERALSNLQRSAVRH